MVEELKVGDEVPALNLRRDERFDIELQLLLDALLRYGSCDFRFLSPPILHRRVADAMRTEGLTTISALQDRVLHNDRAFASFVVSMNGGASSLFADPELLHAVRDCVIPLLRTYSFVRIWVPSPGTGGTAYSLAALLAEAGLLERTVIYATFLNDVVATVAKAALYRHDGRVQLERAARLSGVESPLAKYFEIDDDHVAPKERLRASVMTGRHNLSSDGSINEFHAIMSLGMLPLLNGVAQYRAMSLFFESLARLGFLVLGQDVAKTPHESAFRRVTPSQAIYRRLR
jgi:chemotaxis protein methyltransferase CheR